MKRACTQLKLRKWHLSNKTDLWSSVKLNLFLRVQSSTSKHPELRKISLAWQNLSANLLFILSPLPALQSENSILKFVDQSDQIVMNWRYIWQCGVNRLFVRLFVAADVAFTGCSIIWDKNMMKNWFQFSLCRVIRSSLSSRYRVVCCASGNQK